MGAQMVQPKSNGKQRWRARCACSEVETALRSPTEHWAAQRRPKCADGRRTPALRVPAIALADRLTSTSIMTRCPHTPSIRRRFFNVPCISIPTPERATT
jgi:hypothetical protein